MALEGPCFSSSISFILSAVATTSITIGLVLYQTSFLLHEVIGPGIMVSWYVSLLIIKTFKYMHLIHFISDNCLDLTLSHLTIPGEIDRVP
jgi:hypothetical protein